MRHVVPYRTKRGALAALDNGGRFYNLFTKADDGEITSAELAKVAGTFGDRQTMFLYFDMALALLDPAEKEAVMSALSRELRTAYRHSSPARMSVADARQHGHASQSAIITGVPRHVDSKTQFSGFIMIPMPAGKATTMMMIPIMDQYDVYEVRDDETDVDFLIAHGRGQTLPKTRMRLGGVIKELQHQDRDEHDHHLFLETLYYTYD